MNQDREVLRVVYRTLQESADSMRRIAKELPESAHVYANLLAFNDALSEFVAEMDFVLERGGFDSEALEHLNRVSLEPILRMLEDARLLDGRS